MFGSVKHGASNSLLTSVVCALIVVCALLGRIAYDEYKYIVVIEERLANAEKDAAIALGTALGVARYQQRPSKAPQKEKSKGNFL